MRTDSQMLYDEDDLVMEVNEVPSTMQDTQVKLYSVLSNCKFSNLRWMSYLE